MKKHYLLGMLQGISGFVQGKLYHPDESSVFLKSKERYLLQGVIGIVDELRELSDESEDLEKIKELGDVFFYISLLFSTLATKYQIEKFTDIIGTAKEAVPKKDIYAYSFELLGICKKIVFQGRDDLLEHAVVCCVLLITSLEDEYTEEDCGLGISLMKWKLNKRYGKKFTPEKSKQRKL